MTKQTLMLWLDTSARPLDVRVKEAAVFYQNKYGKYPNTCIVNPIVLEQYLYATDQDAYVAYKKLDVLPSIHIANIPVTTHRSILRQDIHIGFRGPVDEQ